jgi:hypothetical protein
VEIVDKILRLVYCKPETPADRKGRIERLERQVKQLEEQLVFEQREAELKERLKKLKAERRQTSPVPAGKLAVGIGLALVFLLFIAKIAGC